MAKKLHEYLGSQKSVFAQGAKVIQDLATTFSKKDHLFREALKSYTPDGEDAKTTVEAQSTLQTTVPKEIATFLKPILIKALDSEATIDHGNTKARADVIVGTVTILRDVPATQLLQLDKRLGELLSFINTIPTLDPAKGFQKDTQRGNDVYVARDVTERRTDKTEVPLVLHEGTDKHPPQVKSIIVNKEIGTILKQEWSGLITPAQKAEIFNNVENLRAAVKQARARANDIEVEEQKIGEAVLDYVFKPLA